MPQSNRTWIFRFIILGSIVLPAFGQTTAPSTASAEETASRVIKMHDAWGPKASTPGIALSLKEAYREGPVIRIRMYATGLPKEGVYTLLTWPVTQRGPSEELRGITFDESGLAVCAGIPGTCGSPDKPNDPIDLVLKPVPGEPSRLALISADQSVKVFAKIVPIPLRGEDKGCSVEAVLLTPGAEIVFLEGWDSRRTLKSSWIRNLRANATEAKPRPTQMADILVQFCPISRVWRGGRQR